MKTKELIITAIAALRESAKRHKRSSSAHRKHAKQCMMDAVGLKQKLNQEGEEV